MFAVLSYKLKYTSVQFNIFFNQFKQQNKITRIMLFPHHTASYS